MLDYEHPVSGNMQTWTAIVTKSAEKKQQLFKAHRQQQMILQTPVLITFCADTHRMRKWVDLHQSKQSFDDFVGFLTGVMDAALAAQNMVIAAESLDLGCCYMGTTWWAADQISEILQLPDCVFPCTSIVPGYPDETPNVRDRLPLDLVVHEEQYSLPDDDDIFEKA